MFLRASLYIRHAAVETAAVMVSFAVIEDNAPVANSLDNKAMAATAMMIRRARHLLKALPLKLACAHGQAPIP